MERNRILIDTSVLIDHLRKKRKDKTVFFELAKSYNCIISSITEFEFLVGATPQNREFSKNLIAKLVVLPFNSTCVQNAIQIYHNLKLKNKLISLPDIFIAATAITYDLPFRTLNQKHFESVETLKLNIKKSQ